MDAQILAIVEKPLTDVPKRHMTGWLIKLLTSFAQRRRLKHSRWLKAEVSIVETLS
jgi:hypothetical protein